MGKLDGATTIVTGATRGIGRGIALELASEGATVYASGRTLHEGTSSFPGSLDSLVDAAKGFSGEIVPCVCDHRNDEEVEAIFERIDRERPRLDLLVNNAFLVPEDLDPNAPFWETPVSAWDDMMNIGGRSTFVASRLAAQRLVPQKRGLIANVSSPGARYYYVHPAYGAAKSALDRLTRDLGHHLEPHGVAIVSLWPYFVVTERLQMLDTDEWELDLDGAETLRYTGRAVVALATDPNVMARTGRSYTNRQLALDYGFRDEDGSLPLGSPEPVHQWDDRMPPPPVGSKP